MADENKADRTYLYTMVGKQNYIRQEHIRAKCGRGVPQPGWSACTEWGRWWVPGYDHPYCTTHAAQRVRDQVTMMNIRDRILDTSEHE